MVFPQPSQENVGLLRTLIRSDAFLLHTSHHTTSAVWLLTAPGSAPQKKVNRHLSSQLWTLRHWKTFQPCAFYSPARICEAKAPVDALNALNGAFVTITSCVVWSCMVAVQRLAFSFQFDGDKEWALRKRGVELCLALTFVLKSAVRKMVTERNYVVISENFAKKFI